VVGDVVQTAILVGKKLGAGEIVIAVGGLLSHASQDSGHMT